MKTSVNRLLLLIFSSSCWLKAVAQTSSNYITISNTSVNFNLTTAIQLETQQQITNAIALGVSNNTTYTVYIRVSDMTNTSGTPIPANLLSMQLNTYSCARCTVLNSITLSQTDQQIIQATKKGGLDNYYYKLLLGPIGYSYGPGNYTFTMLYTMTTP